MATKNGDSFENTIHTIDQLSEKEAKALLKIIYGFVNTAITGNGGDPAKIEIIEKVFDIYERIQELTEVTDNLKH